MKTEQKFAGAVFFQKGGMPCGFVEKSLPDFMVCNPFHGRDRGTVFLSGKREALVTGSTLALPHHARGVPCVKGCRAGGKKAAGRNGFSL